jgi:SHS2 domain-containing protein
MARGARGVQLRHDVKSATYHGLVVEREGGTWSLTAYLDI